MEKVAIILVNYNSALDTIECLKSIEKLEYPNFEVFLLDNGSKSENVLILTENLKLLTIRYHLTVIYGKENLGFAGGNNVLINKAREKGFLFYWLLNNDTEVEPLALNALMETMNSSQNIGIVGSKIFYFFEKDLLWFAGGKYNKILGRTKHIGLNDKDKEEYNVTCEVDYITGCSLLTNASVIDKIGLIEEDYFLYYEETDFNFKAKKAGFKVIYEPKSVLYHKVSRSFGNKFNPLIYYYMNRNALVLSRRTQSKFTYLLLVILKPLEICALAILKFTKKNNLSRFKYSLKGYFDALKKRMGKL